MIWTIRTSPYQRSLHLYLLCTLSTYFETTRTHSVHMLVLIYLTEGWRSKFPAEKAQLIFFDLTWLVPVPSHSSPFKRFYICPNTPLHKSRQESESASRGCFAPSLCAPLRGGDVAAVHPQGNSFVVAFYSYRPMKRPAHSNERSKPCNNKERYQQQQPKQTDFEEILSNGNTASTIQRARSTSQGKRKGKQTKSFSIF